MLEPTAKLLPLLTSRGIRLVFFSSGGAVYGATVSNGASEDHPRKPISLYGKTKLELELEIERAHQRSGLQYLILRPSNPFGPRQSLQGSQGLISVVFGKILAGQPLQVWGDGLTIRDYIYIDDLAFSVHHLIECGAENMAVNIGSGVGHSLLDVVESIQKVLRSRIALRFERARSVDVPRAVWNVALLKELGGWRSRALEVGIELYARKLGLKA